MNGLNVSPVTQCHGLEDRNNQRWQVSGTAAVAGLALIMVFALTGCVTPGERSPETRVTEGRVIKIATQSPLSGPQAALGEAIKLGAQLAVEKLKGSIESAGYTIELVPFDDQAKPAVGVANARNIVGNGDAPLKY